VIQIGVLSLHQRSSLLAIENGPGMAESMKVLLTMPL